MDTESRARIGVDIGGTFTDLVLTDTSGRLYHRKVTSTPSAPEKAVLTGVAAIIKDAEIEAGRIAEVVHGTTVGSNTLLQKLGAATGLITTKGFRDVLEIGRLRTPGMFDLQWEKPEPLVRRRHRCEVTERIAADGSVLTPLDSNELMTVAEELISAGLTSLAICFLNSYRNPAHEQEAERILTAAFPELEITTSVSVLPEAKEYERTSTAVVNAYVRPALKLYLARLEDGLHALGINAPLMVSNSNGALASSQTAREKPVFFISSGRAAGAAGGARLGAALNTTNLVVFDMGGTTASASLVADGELSRVSEYEFRAGISTPSRFIKAGGYMMSVPAVDVAEVGSGAGSIAHVDEGGLMKVGPVSAGAEPGPVCYGIGGDRPTVTDSNLVLGYLPQQLAGGSRSLDLTRAQEVIDRDLAAPFGLTMEKAAYGVREVVNANMARAIRAVTVERGVDPRDFDLVAIGGSGPVHAADIARLLSMKRILVPASPGVFTAMGMLAGDVERYFITPFPGLLENIDVEAATAKIAACEAQARTAVLEEGIPEDAVQLTPEIDLRFRGQEMSLSVPLGDPMDAAAIRTRYLDAYRAIYSYSSSDQIEMVSLRVTGRGQRPGKLDFRLRREAEAETQATIRKVYYDEVHGWLDTPCYERFRAPTTLRGPAILEGTDSTVVIPPDAKCTRDPYLNLLIEMDDA